MWRRNVALSAFCVAMLAICGATTHVSARSTGDANAGSDPAAEAVFSKCRDAWSRTVLPRSLRYVVAVTARTNRDIDERYSGIMGSSEDDYRVDRFSTGEYARPARPTGTNVYLTLFGRDVVRLNNDTKPTNILGSPQLSPRFSFGMERLLVPDPQESASSSLVVIGTVTARSNTYDVRFLGTEPGDGANIVHLGLWPRRDPRIFRLRELWVDERTDRPVRAIVAGNFTDGPSLGVRWSITYQTVGGVSYIATESALAPLFFSRTRRYENVIVSFVDLQPSSVTAPIMATFHGLRSDADLREPD